MDEDENLGAGPSTRPTKWEKLDKLLRSCFSERKYDRMSEAKKIRYKIMISVYLRNREFAKRCTLKTYLQKRKPKPVKICPPSTESTSQETPSQSEDIEKLPALPSSGSSSSSDESVQTHRKPTLEELWDASDAEHELERESERERIAIEELENPTESQEVRKKKQAQRKRGRKRKPQAKPKVQKVPRRKNKKRATKPSIQSTAIITRSRAAAKKRTAERDSSETNDFGSSDTRGAPQNRNIGFPLAESKFQRRASQMLQPPPLGYLSQQTSNIPILPPPLAPLASDNSSLSSETTTVRGKQPQISKVLISPGFNVPRSLEESRGQRQTSLNTRTIQSLVPKENQDPLRSVESNVSHIPKPSAEKPVNSAALAENLESNVTEPPLTSTTPNMQEMQYWGSPRPSTSVLLQTFEDFANALLQQTVTCSTFIPTVPASTAVPYSIHSQSSTSSNRETPLRVPFSGNNTIYTTAGMETQLSSNTTPLPIMTCEREKRIQPKRKPTKRFTVQCKPKPQTIIISNIISETPESRPLQDITNSLETPRTIEMVLPVGQGQENRCGESNVAETKTTDFVAEMQPIPKKPVIEKPLPSGKPRIKISPHEKACPAHGIASTSQTQQYLRTISPITKPALKTPTAGPSQVPVSLSGSRVPTSLLLKPTHSKVSGASPNLSDEDQEIITIQFPPNVDQSQIQALSSAQTVETEALRYTYPRRTRSINTNCNQNYLTPTSEPKLFRVPRPQIVPMNLSIQTPREPHSVQTASTSATLPAINQTHLKTIQKKKIIIKPPHQTRPLLLKTVQNLSTPSHTITETQTKPIPVLKLTSRVTSQTQIPTISDGSATSTIGQMQTHEAITQPQVKACATKNVKTVAKPTLRSTAIAGPSGIKPSGPAKVDQTQCASAPSKSENAITNMEQSMDMPTTSQLTNVPRMQAITTEDQVMIRQGPETALKRPLKQSQDGTGSSDTPDQPVIKKQILDADSGTKEFMPGSCSRGTTRRRGRPSLADIALIKKRFGLRSAAQSSSASLRPPLHPVKVANFVKLLTEVQKSAAKTKSQKEKNKLTLGKVSSVVEAPTAENQPFTIISNEYQNLQTEMQESAIVPQASTPGTSTDTLAESTDALIPICTESAEMPSTSSTLETSSSGQPKSTGISVGKSGVYQVVHTSISKSKLYTADEMLAAEVLVTDLKGNLSKIQYKRVTPPNSASNSEIDLTALPYFLNEEVLMSDDELLLSDKLLSEVEEPLTSDDDDMGN